MIATVNLFNKFFCCRNVVIIIFALVTDLVDVSHEGQSSKMRQEEFSNGALYFFYCGCLLYILYSATTLFDQLMFCTCRSLSDIDKPLCAVVWFGDFPQALYDMQFSKGNSDPRTIYGWPHAFAVLAGLFWLCHILHKKMLGAITIMIKVVICFPWKNFALKDVHPRIISQ